jgi:CheY-like chemotaxis protein
MSRSILLADDSVTIQKVIELTFMDDDYEVKAVGNGDEAIAYLAAANVDFVIADVHMPGANGYEVARRAKELRPHLPVLLLVGTFEPFDEAQARACGADSFLKKPFDSQELLQRVHELLGPAPPQATAQAVAPEKTTAQALAPEGTTAAPEAAAAGGTPPQQEPHESHEPAMHPADAAPAAHAAAAAPQELSAAPEWHGFELEAEPEPPAESPAAAEAGGVHPLAGEEPATARVPISGVFDQPFTLGEPLDEKDFRLEPPEPLPAPPTAPFEIESEPQPFSLDEGPAAETLEAAKAAPHPAGFGAMGAMGAIGAVGAMGAMAATAATEERAEHHPVAAPAALSERSSEPLSQLSEAFLFSQVAAPATPADTGSAGAAEGLPPAAELAAPVARAAPADISDGQGAAPTAAPPASPPVPLAASAPPGLSAEDVDRIAHRVVELLGDKVVRDVAWEVIPDLAEVVIKDRLRELEGQIE